MTKDEISKIIQACAMLHSIATNNHISIEIPANRDDGPWVTLNYLKELYELGEEMRVVNRGKVYRVISYKEGVIFSVENVTEPYLKEYGLHIP
jgi:hypothetical protein